MIANVNISARSLIDRAIPIRATECLAAPQPMGN